MPPDAAGDVVDDVGLEPGGRLMLGRVPAVLDAVGGWLAEAGGRAPSSFAAGAGADTASGSTEGVLGDGSDRGVSLATVDGSAVSA